MLRRILALIMKELSSLWKDPKSRMVLVVPPLIQVIIFAHAATFDVSGAALAIWNDDRGSLAGELVRRGADLAKICDEVYQSYPLSRIGLLRHIYSHFRLKHQNQIAYFWLKKADFARAGAESSDSEGLIDHIREIAPVVVACVFEEIEPALTRISLRSKSDKVNVNEIAAQFGGGGHPAAAGARIAGSPLSVQRKVISAIKKAINSSR